MNEEWSNTIKRRKRMLFSKPINTPCEICKKVPVVGRKYNAKKEEYEWVCGGCY